MKKYSIYAICLVFFLSVAACCHREVVVLVPDEQGNVGKIEVAGEKGSVSMTEAWRSTTISASGTPGKVEKIDPKKVEKLFGNAMAANLLPPLEYRLHFLSGTDQITPKSMEQIPSMVAAILARENAEITIIGHTDRTGLATANMLLSEKRTKIVQQLLVEHGIPESTLKDIRHYGESMPIVPTADGVAEPRNRRVEVFVR